MKNKWLKIMSISAAILIMLTACGRTATEDNYQQKNTVPKATEQPGKTEDKTEMEAKSEVKEQPKPEEKPENYGDRKFQVIAPAGVPTIGLLKMIKENTEIAGAKMEYESIVATDALAPKLISGEADFAVVPSNLAIKLYNKGAEYRYVGSTVWGVLYLAAGSDEIKTWQDLKGKKIVLIGRGLTPDLTLRYLLQQNGLTPETDVALEYVSGATELAPMFLAGKADIALLPEPMLSQVMTKKPETKVVFDIQAEWKNITNGESYPQTAVLVKKEVIDQYPVLVETFLARLLESVEFANIDPQTAGTYMEEIDANMKAAVIAKAIANCNLEYKDAEQSRQALETYFERLKEFGAENIGGKMPDENFYYQK
ncbi:ABC transporter substrate-binding protein [Clostridiales bacterium COT073_COT-073]|nr:ABC transporter substrate-binding protein [Clostridiales bacterium COT073_COT-073]